MCQSEKMITLKKRISISSIVASSLCWSAIQAALVASSAVSQELSEPKLFLRMGGRDGSFYDQYITQIETFSASTQEVTVETRHNTGKVDATPYYVTCGDPDAPWTNTVAVHWRDEPVQINPDFSSSAIRTEYNLYWAICRGVYEKT
jgi:hypothetical protein